MSKDDMNILSILRHLVSSGVSSEELKSYLSKPIPTRKDLGTEDEQGEFMFTEIFQHAKKWRNHSVNGTNWPGQGDPEHPEFNLDEVDVRKYPFSIIEYTSSSNWQPFHWKGWERDLLKAYLDDKCTTREAWKIFCNIRKELAPSEKEIHLN